MKTLSKWLGGAMVVASLTAAAPASAQYYDDYYYGRDRYEADRVASGVAAVAGAMAAATQGYYDPRYGNRYGYGSNYGVGGERYAVDSCAYEAQRRFGRRYGVANVAIRDVRPYRYNRVRVLGAVDLGGGYYGGYDRYNRGRVAFSCTARPDGRVTGFSTHNYDW